MYVERDCVFSANGHSFESGGAVVTPDVAIGYLTSAEPGKLVVTNWHGDRVLGNAYIVAKWRTPTSVYSEWMHQVEVVIDGRTYTGRSNGVGMVWKGKPKSTRRHS
jgi:hypothetical protein